MPNGVSFLELVTEKVGNSPTPFESPRYISIWGETTRPGSNVTPIVSAILARHDRNG